MSMTPNTNTQSPPQEATTQKVVVPLPVIAPQDLETYYYVFVKGSLYASDTHVFGLEVREIQALSTKFAPPKQVENGVMFKNPVHQVINSLAQLGYRIVSSCGEVEQIFTLQREV
ncbi:hypothetical protein PVAND_005798 [Polypedilum vanderplanki]|uniref:Uncharacterized protein n=1 Tax=Polypedilum vanderplanki TaxID=319348 RepID=A0A9J6C246_POLVA|nr:hypothetical protein PVAND_005798 [Polypedilum vanderplanki]